MPRVTAKRQPNETGLARVCQSPRGYIISVDGKPAGRVAAFSRILQCEGWYFYANVGDARINTCQAKPFPTREDACDACVAWVKARLAETKAADHG